MAIPAKVAAVIDRLIEAARDAWSRLISSFMLGDHLVYGRQEILLLLLESFLPLQNLWPLDTLRGKGNKIRTALQKILDPHLEVFHMRGILRVVPPFHVSESGCGRPQSVGPL